LSAALLLALALQGGTEAAVPAPAALSEPTIMVVEFPRGAPYVGLPRRCPGTPADEPTREDDICLAELYQGRTDVVLHLAGPRAGPHPLIRLTAHARRWRPGTRMLVATQPFEDQGTVGNFAIWWHLPEEDGDFCLEAEDLPTWGDNPVTRLFATGYRRHFRASGYLESFDFRCLHGWRRSMRDL
jgi:hypothetical protein